MARKQTIRTKTKPVSRGKQQGGEFVSTPLTQSVISSTVIAIMFACLCYVFAWSINIVILSFGISLCLIWFYRLHLFDSLLFAIEKVVQTDLTGDNQIGKPSHLIVKNAPSARAKAASQVKESGRDTRLSQLETFTKKCYSIGTSESAQGIKPNDRAIYLENRDTLFRLGIADWKGANPKSGWKMLLPEDAALEAIKAHVTQT